MKTLLSVFVMMIVLGTGYYMGSIAKTEPPKVTSAAESSIIDYVNKVRADNGVAPVREDTGLDATAKIKADDMQVRNYWDHTNPDGTPFQMLLLQNRPGLKLYGENLAECFTGNEATVKGWIGSEGHLKNMINPRYNVLGSATVWDQDKSCLITVNHFGEE